MVKEIKKYPYNVSSEDELRTFLSDQIFEEILRIIYKNGKIFGPIKVKDKIIYIKDKVNSKRTEILIAGGIAGAALFGGSREAKPIGLPVPPSLSSVDEIHHQAPQYIPQYATTIDKQLEKIVMIVIDNKKIMPLIYINGKYSYTNEQLLKKLRAGDLSSNLTMVVIGFVVYLIVQASNGDAFQIFSNWNAPQPSPMVGPGPSSSSTQLSVIPTKAHEFNEPQISYNYVMSYQEAKRQLNEMYADVLEISSDTHVSDIKAAAKIYHASQLVIYPEDYGMKKEDVKRINAIGIYNYAREGRPLPPIKLIKDYQMAIKNISNNGITVEGTYSSKADQKIHETIYKYDRQRRELAGFYKETGEFITAHKLNKKSFENFLLTHNLGNLN